MDILRFSVWPHFSQAKVLTDPVTVFLCSHLKH